MRDVAQCCSTSSLFIPINAAYYLGTSYVLYCTCYKLGRNLLTQIIAGYATFGFGSCELGTIFYCAILCPNTHTM